jgi:hypothetical protein
MNMERRNFIEKVIAGAAAGAATTGVTQLLKFVEREVDIRLVRA